MDSLVKGLLENLVERLTKIETQQETQLKKQSQIDQVIERLDTIHNRQTQLESKLSDVSTQVGENKTSITDKLSTISTQLEDEKVFMRDQLSTISTQLNEEKVFMRDQLKEAQDEILHRLSELQQQNVSTRSQAVSVGEEMKQLQATAGPNPVKETAEFCSQADGDVMDARLAKMSETLEQSVKAVTRAELVWLDNRTQQHISKLSEKVGELSTDFKMDVAEEIRAQNEPMMKEVQGYLKNIAEENRNSVSQQREDMKTFYTETVTQTNKASSELPRTLDEVKKEIKDYVETVKVEIIADSNTAIVKVKDEFTEAQKLLQDLDKTKRDLVALVEGQSHKIALLLPQLGLYTFDFYIENFRQLVRSDETMKSEDWLIKQICTSFRGVVFFYSYDDEMIACLQYSKYHNNLGARLQSGATLRITVTIKDTSGQLSDILVGQETYTWVDKYIKKGESWGKIIGKKSCAELVEKGYGQREGYKKGALLLRYEIEVM